MNLRARHAKLSEQLLDRNLDALLVVEPTNIAYFATYRPRPYERLIALILTSDGDCRLVAPSLEVHDAEEVIPFPCEIYEWDDASGPRQALEAALGVKHPLRLGIEEDSLSVARARLISELHSNVTLVDCGSILMNLRVVKDDDEMAALRRAAAVADIVVREIGHAIAVGVSEEELSSLGAAVTREQGATNGGIAPSVLTGARGALPHAQSGPTTLASGDLVIVDVLTVVDGYWGDITRTFVVDAPTPEQSRMFDTVRRAQRAGLERCCAGVATGSVDEATRTIITEEGYGDFFAHRTGHGLGLDVHEPPYLHASNPHQLAEGMVVTVEPGIYVPQLGGVRIEDDVWVGPDGPESLTAAPIALTSER